MGCVAHRDAENLLDRVDRGRYQTRLRQVPNHKDSVGRGRFILNYLFLML